MAKIQAFYDTDYDKPAEIHAYMQCAKCLAECPPDQSPAEWARLNFGLCRDGWQLWCVRHDCNVAIITVKPKQKKSRVQRRAYRQVRGL